MNTTYSLSQADAGTNAFIEFDIDVDSGMSWTARVKEGGNTLASVGPQPVGGHYRLDFPSASSGTLTFELQATCGSATGNVSASASNLFGSRIP
jgi:hypothetical protein